MSKQKDTYVKVASGNAVNISRPTPEFEYLHGLISDTEKGAEVVRARDLSELYQMVSILSAQIDGLKAALRATWNKTDTDSADTGGDADYAATLEPNII